MKLTIATRGSALALWQANHIKSLIENKHPGCTVELNVIKTTGDKILDVPLAKIGGKGLFVKEIETALLEKKADLAVHSMKDVPVELPHELEIYVNPERESPNDAFLSVKYNSISELPEGAVVGTSSLRRKLQLLQYKPFLTIKDLRGNVDTRIRKMTEGEFDAIILAQSGLNRLGLTEHVKETITSDKMIPAVCQGALGIEVRKDDAKTKELLTFMKDPVTETAVAAERAFLTRLNGGCQAPIACHAVINGDNIVITGYLSSLDGKNIYKHDIKGEAKDAGSLGDSLAQMILSDGGAEVLRSIYS